MEKFKASLVSKGYSHVEEIYIGKIFLPIVKLNSIIFILFVYSTFDIEVEYMDVNITFLHIDLEE